MKINQLMLFFIQIVGVQQKCQLTFGEAINTHIYKQQKQHGEDAYSQYSSEVDLSKDEFINKIKQKHSDLQIDFSSEDAVQIKEKTDGGRVKTLKVGNLELSGVEVRTILGLRSANFNFEIGENNIKFKVTGYGHGVGMSQTGADALAKQGNNYEDIIKHFYVGVEIVDGQKLFIPNKILIYK